MKQFTVRAAAAELGVGYSTIKQWIHRGRVRTSQTPGGHHRVSEHEVERLLGGRTRSTPRRTGAAPAGLAGLSARNQLRGAVEEVRTDGLLAQVRLRIGDQLLTAVITADAVRALKLRRGDTALAIVKSTEVMIAKAQASAPQSSPAGGRGAPRRSA